MDEKLLAELAKQYAPQIEAMMEDLKANDSNAYWDIYDEYGKAVLSDEEMKYVKKLAARGGPFDEVEVAFLSRMAGPDEEGHSWENQADWDESIIDKYAEHLKNYLYQYKPEACEVDPTIDPSEEQIGIMAQDLEQVNPACVKETPEGVKVVDTERLALMNAGAIADLARKIAQIEQILGIGE